VHQKPPPLRPGGSSFKLRAVEKTSMLVGLGKARPEMNLLLAFTLSIAGALAAGPANGLGDYLGFFLRKPGRLLKLFIIYE
jgi:hypothetical protein